MSNDTSWIMRIFAAPSHREADTEPVHLPPKEVPRPTHAIQHKTDFDAINMHTYTESGLSVTITGTAAREMTIADVGDMMKQAAESRVDLMVEWDMPDSGNLAGQSG